MCSEHNLISYENENKVNRLRDGTLFFERKGVVVLTFGAKYLSTCSNTFPMASLVRFFSRFFSLFQAVGQWGR